MPRMTLAGAISSLIPEPEAKVGELVQENSSTGRIVLPTSTAESSPPLPTLPKTAKEPTPKPRPVAKGKGAGVGVGRKKRRRKSKVNAQTLLEIAQSALARLEDAGLEVWVKAEVGEKGEAMVVVRIVGAEYDGEKMIVKKESLK